MEAAFRAMLGSVGGAGGGAAATAAGAAGGGPAGTGAGAESTLIIGIPLNQKIHPRVRAHAGWAVLIVAVTKGDLI